MTCWGSPILASLTIFVKPEPRHDTADVNTGVAGIYSACLIRLRSRVVSQQIGECHAVVRTVDCRIERERILFTRALVGRLLTDLIRELVADDLGHVGHGRRRWIGSKSSAHHDPMRQAVLHQIVELLAREASKSSSELTHQFLGNRDFPTVEAISRLKHRASPRRFLDGGRSGISSVHLQMTNARKSPVIRNGSRNSSKSPDMQATGPRPDTSDRDSVTRQQGAR